MIIKAIIHLYPLELPEKLSKTNQSALGTGVPVTGKFD